jgi:ergothioneine biosynthesis protein EgtB
MALTDLQDIARLYGRVRAATEALTAPLSAEDQMVQSMPLASPTKWHLAHTTWYFETFVLGPHLPGYRPVFGASDRMWNSYYETVAPPPERGLRSTLSRPSLVEVLNYRHQVDAAVRRLCEQDLPPEAVNLLVLGVNHEEQHQELILTDIKHAFSVQPLRPAYQNIDVRRPLVPEAMGRAPPQRWHSYPGGVVPIGHEGPAFSFDNECPRHRVLLEPFSLAHRAVTCGEYQAFIDDGGYRRPELWLSDGWAAARTGGWQAPLYWEETDGGFRHLTLAGMREVAEDEPVCHISYYEADAFARWAGARLPREAEWEHAAAKAKQTSDHPKANLLEQGALHPMAAPQDDSLHPVQLLGDVWEWTQSPYVPYPGYRRAEGALGEYNGKFMSNQLVLRGGSCVTPQRHLRVSYRNFFPPDARWQFTGIRLAQDAGQAGKADNDATEDGGGAGGVSGTVLSRH